MAYTTVFKPGFFKDLKKLPKQVRERLVLVIESLRKDPLSLSVKKLIGHSHLYRYRLGDYRLVFYVHHSKKKLIFLLIAHRKEIYQRLKKIT